MDPQPTIAIVGKPNVGKSTIFNRLVGKKIAITSEHAGTTRDRVYQNCDINGYNCILVDTGGIECGKKENIEADVQEQANLAISDADVTLFVLDLSQNLTTDDFVAAEILRKSRKEVILIANKNDNQSIGENVYNIYELGFGEPVMVSAIHRTGIDELKDVIEKRIKSLKFKKGKLKCAKNMTNIAILGKPNAGKSSLINSLLGADKIIVSDVAGTTRDSLDTEIKYEGKAYNMIDTAGLRRPGKRGKGIEKYSALRCICAVKRADVVVLLLDGNDGVTNQDSHIVKFALDAGKGIILVISKMDMLDMGEEAKEPLKNAFRERFPRENPHRMSHTSAVFSQSNAPQPIVFQRFSGNAIVNRLRQKFAFIPWAPVIFVSAMNKKNIYEIFTIADQIVMERKKRIATAELNNFLQKVMHRHLPAGRGVKKPKFMYATQVETDPPKFTLFFKNPETLHFSYPRYIENEIRKEYGFVGTCIELKIKKQENH